MSPAAKPADPSDGVRSAGLTLLALLAFAGNSLLCRLALASGEIDPVGFTTLRLASGSLVLLLLVTAQRATPTGSWRSGLALLAYALPFSLAYVDLPAGTGALLLFGAVQLTMVATGVATGERPSGRVWTGMAVALAGLVYLVRPGLGAPRPVGVLAMLVAGVSWGIYSLRGRRAGAPVPATAGNFLRATVLLAVPATAVATTLHATPRGAALAVASGAITSGLGYVAWYAALRHLDATRAAVAQLSVPALAALGGVLLLGESATPRLLVGAGLILGGVGLAVVRRTGRR